MRKKIQFNAVFLPSPYKRHRKTYNKTNVVDVSDFAGMGVLDSQQSLANLFDDFSPKRSPFEVAAAISPTVTSSSKHRS